MIDYESDYDDMEEVPYIQLELDIRDVCQIYRSLDFHNKNGNITDENELERLDSIKDFFNRMILEYKYQIGE
tara:strand:+ start:125 stop:340 length:216 start_codon:yes stop_codon:yes gene_type:complete